MNKVKILNSILALILLLVVAATTTYAWYLGFVGVETNDSEKLSSEGKYYASGDGTQDNPYVITTARHFYNLCWLQDLGYYDDKIYYFKLGANIDMSDLKKDGVQSPVPPIGIDSHPFISNFDGQGYTISNLYTSTNFNNDKYIKPSDNILKEKGENTIDSDIIKTSYVGLFGYIGSKTYNTSLDSMVTNFTIAKAQIETTKSSLVGFICGYADNNLSKIGVAESNIKIAKDVSPIQGEAAITGKSYTTDISLYGIVGDYSDNAGITPGSGSGSDTDWGGSIDFESLNQRLTYIMANSTKSSYNYKSTAFNTNIYYTSSTAFNITSTSLQSAILNSGTYLPLNVDSSKITEDNYKTASSESVLSTNTGYIVGEGSGSNGYLRSMHNKTNKDNSVVNCSFYTLNSEADSPSRADSLSSSNISFLWLTNEGKTYRIRDDDNKDNVSSYTIPSKYKSTYTSGIYAGIMNSSSSDTSYAGLNLVKYNDVKSNFISSLTAATTDTFYGTKCYLALNYLQLKTKTEPKATTYSNVTLNGTTGSYDLFSGGINYTLKQDGYMSMLCGMSYQGEGEKGNLPDIYYVDSSSGTKTLKKIYKIIKKNGKTAFKFDDTSLSSDETLVFDLNKMSTGTLMEVGCIYYFEFPMIAGDYFMTRYDSTTKVYVPYIYYLDIGANADGSSTEDTGVLKSVDYTYVDDKESNGYNLITEDIVCNIGFKLSNASTTDVYLYIFKTKVDPHQVLYYFEGSGTEVSTNGDSVKKESKEGLKD